MAVERIDYLNDDEFRQAQEEEYEEGQEQEQEQEEAPAMSFIEEKDVAGLIDMHTDEFLKYKLSNLPFQSPLTPEQVEGLKRTCKDCNILKEDKEFCKEVGHSKYCSFLLERNKAISHINANYWLIPKKEGEVNAD